MRENKGDKDEKETDKSTSIVHFGKKKKQFKIKPRRKKK